MAERRINRRSHTMHNKNNNTPVIPEEDEQTVRSEKSVISKPKDATVEVTVKVKKRRDKSDTKLVPLQDKVYRKGSWGDLLLSSSRVSLNNDDDEGRKPKKESSTNVRKASSKREDYERKSCKDDHSPLCQKIPITEDLYLETHTHFKKANYDDRSDADRTTNISQKRVLAKENESLRREVERLRKEIKISKVRYDQNNDRVLTITPTSSKNYNAHDHYEMRKESRSSGFAQGTQTSTNCLASPKKGSKQSTGTDMVDGRLADMIPSKPVSSTQDTSTRRKSDVPAPAHLELKQFETMRLENDELRNQISLLLMDINKTRTENRDYCTIMQELHQAAEDLKKHNIDLQQKYDMLVMNSHEQQAVQSQLLQVLAQSNEMKQVLEILKEKQGSPTGIEDCQLSHFRNVIKDVKSTIAREMEGLGRQSSTAFLVEKDSTDSAFRINNSAFNDTNSSEIQKIFGTEPPEARRGGLGQDENSSSTQYLTIEGLCGFESSNHRPSPLMSTKYSHSPRISTPNSFSEFSLNLSEAGASSLQQPSSGFIPIYKPNTNQDWTSLQDEISRSFLPIRNESSSGSTSSYSGSSTSSSLNSMLKS